MWICWSKQQHTWIFWRVKRWWRWHWTQQKEGNSKTLWEDKKLGLELSCACFKICCFNMISKILLVNVTTTNKCPPLSINSQNLSLLTYFNSTGLKSHTLLLTIHVQPATYWPYLVNFNLHLFFPGGGVGGWVGLGGGGNNQTQG